MFWGFWFLLGDDDEMGRGIGVVVVVVVVDIFSVS